MRCQVRYGSVVGDVQVRGALWTAAYAAIPPAPWTTRTSLSADAPVTRCSTDFRAPTVDYFRLSVSPADALSEVVVVPGKYQRQLPAAVTVTLVVSCPMLPVVTVLTVL